MNLLQRCNVVEERYLRPTTLCAPYSIQDAAWHKIESSYFTLGGNATRRRGTKVRTTRGARDDSPEPAGLRRDPWTISIAMVGADRAPHNSFPRYFLRPLAASCTTQTTTRARLIPGWHISADRRPWRRVDSSQTSKCSRSEKALGAVYIDSVSKWPMAD